MIPYDLLALIVDDLSHHSLATSTHAGHRSERPEEERGGEDEADGLHVRQAPNVEAAD